MSSALHIDIETFSALDLRKVGTHVYAEHFSTEILCLAYAIDDAPVKVWRIADKDPCPEDLRRAWEDHGTMRHAWNAGGFEMVFEKALDFLIEPCGGAHSQTGPDRWRDTMIRAAYWGCPMGLDDAAKALNLPFTKDMEGRRLMLQLCKPRRSTGGQWHVDDADKYDRLCAYCMADVEVERAIGEALPLLPTATQKEWELDWTIMQRGLPINLKAVDALAATCQQERTRLDNELRRLTAGKVTAVTQVSAFLKWAYMHGYPYTTLDKATVAEALFRTDLDPVLLQALRIRQEAAKSSVAKLTAMRASTCSDETIKGLTQFYGASRTGRWSGRLVQVQNLPRPIKDPKTVLEKASSSLRSMFEAPSGDIFVVGDFSQIEARVIAWLAGQKDILEVFSRGEDVYTYVADKLGSKDRQFGKVLVLACGFGMGWAKFQDTAKTYGLDLSDSEAQNAVSGWRTANPEIVAFWRALENACRWILGGTSQKRTLSVGDGKITVGRGANKLAGCLLIRLPSGRQLVYRNARLVPGHESWHGPQIVYDGVNQTTRQWETTSTYGGKLAENVTQAVARDFLMHALQRLPGTYMSALATVHDEIVALAHDTLRELTKKDMMHRMETPPLWGGGMPLAADVKVMERYGK